MAKSWANRRARLWSLWLLVGISTLYLYQNCSQGGFQTFQVSETTSLELPSSHPPIDGIHKTLKSKPQARLASRTYVFDILSQTLPSWTPQRRALMGQLYEKIMANSTSFGASCNHYGSAYAFDCNQDMNSATTGYFKPTQAIRQTFLSRSCEVLSENAVAFDYVIQFLGQDPQAHRRAPERRDIIFTLEHFYRSSLIEDGALPSTIEEEIALQTSTRDKWRLLFLSICQSPDWQLL